MLTPATKRHDNVRHLPEVYARGVIWQCEFVILSVFQLPKQTNLPVSRQYHQHRLRAVSQLKDSPKKRTGERARTSPAALKRDARVEPLV